MLNRVLLPALLALAMVGTAAADAETSDTEHQKVVVRKVVTAEAPMVVALEDAAAEYEVVLEGIESSDSSFAWVVSDGEGMTVLSTSSLAEAHDKLMEALAKLNQSGDLSNEGFAKLEALLGELAAGMKHSISSAPTATGEWVGEFEFAPMAEYEDIIVRQLAEGEDGEMRQVQIVIDGDDLDFTSEGLTEEQLAELKQKISQHQAELEELHMIQVAPGAEGHGDGHTFMFAPEVDGEHEYRMLIEELKDQEGQLLELKEHGYITGEELADVHEHLLELKELGDLHKIELHLQELENMPKLDLHMKELEGMHFFPHGEGDHDMFWVQGHGDAGAGWEELRAEIEQSLTPEQLEKLDAFVKGHAPGDVRFDFAPEFFFKGDNEIKGLPHFSEGQGIFRLDQQMAPHQFEWRSAGPDGEWEAEIEQLMEKIEVMVRELVKRHHAE